VGSRRALLAAHHRGRAWEGKGGGPHPLPSHLDQSVRQIPAPSQVLVAPQIAPDGSAVHLASEPEPLQLRHLSAQAVPQQAPSTQKPDLHSWLLLHATPASFCGKHDSSPSQ